MCHTHAKENSARFLVNILFSQSGTLGTPVLMGSGPSLVSSNAQQLNGQRQQFRVCLYGTPVWQIPPRLGMMHSGFVNHLKEVLQLFQPSMIFLLFKVPSPRTKTTLAGSEPKRLRAVLMTTRITGSGLGVTVFRKFLKIIILWRRGDSSDATRSIVARQIFVCGSKIIHLKLRVQRV